MICCCSSKEESDAKEIELIKRLCTKRPFGYNLTDGGGGGLGWIPSVETRAKIGRANKGNTYNLGKKHSDERVAVNRKAQKIYWQTDEGKKTRKELNTLLRGRKASAETRASLSKAHMGRKNSAEAIARTAASNTGKKRTPEQCAKISKACMGRKHTTETIAKIAKWNKGKKQPEEQKAKISESQKLAWIIRKQKKVTEAEIIERMRL